MVRSALFLVKPALVTERHRHIGASVDPQTAGEGRERQLYVNKSVLVVQV
jgi:hypothetical protein